MGMDDAGHKLPAVQGGPEDIQTAWRLLAGGAPVAAAALVDIAEHGKSELARVQASTAILDRVGLATPKERPTVIFPVIPEEFGKIGIGAEQISPAEVVRSRLKKLAELASSSGSHPGDVDGPGDDGLGAAALDGFAGWLPGQGQQQADLEPVDAELVDEDGDPWG
jgi:hypothetical protein